MYAIRSYYGIPEQEPLVFRVQGKSQPEGFKSVFTCLFFKLNPAFQVP